MAAEAADGTSGPLLLAQCMSASLNNRLDEGPSIDRKSSTRPDDVVECRGGS
jgi:hypothetical protein